MRSIQRWGRRALIAGLGMTPGIGHAPLAHAGVTLLIPRRGCERSYVRELAFSNGSRPDILTVRATGPTCGRASIVVTLCGASRQVIWRERTYLGLVESERFPSQPAPDVTFEHVIGVVETWVSVEKTSDAPPWPDGAHGPGQDPGQPLTQYDTKLGRRLYEQIRAAHEPMVCIPTGPESAHCIAIDPSTRTAVEFLGRGV